MREGDGRLAGPAGEDARGDGGVGGDHPGQVGELGVAGGAEDGQQREDADEEAEVADPVGDEGLAPGVGLLLVGVPEADQQVAAEADALPPDEGEQQRVAEHQREHGRDEEVQVGEEAGVAGVVLVRHVGRRVDVDEGADAGDDQQHGAGEPVDQQPPGHGDDGPAVGAGDGDPGVAREAQVAAGQDPGEGDGGDGQGAHHGADGDQGGVSLADAAADQPVDQGAGQREQDDGPEARLGRGGSRQEGHRSGAKDYPLGQAKATIFWPLFPVGATGMPTRRVHESAAVLFDPT